MAKVAIRPNARTQQVWEDLDRFQEFCRDFGYRYNEADLYNFKSYAIQQFNKHAQRKADKGLWFE